MLGDVRVRLTAELGRARMPIGELLGLSPGRIVELSDRHDDPIRLYANGQPFGTARMVRTAGGRTALQLESLGTVSATGRVLRAPAPGDLADAS